jgi:four helix bundle protein
LFPELCRAAISVATDIGEAFRRCGTADEARFLDMADCALDECRYYLILIHELGLEESDNVSQLLEELSSLLHHLLNRGYVIETAPDAGAFEPAQPENAEGY